MLNITLISIKINQSRIGVRFTCLRAVPFAMWFIFSYVMNKLGNYK